MSTEQDRKLATGYSAFWIFRAMASANWNAGKREESIAAIASAIEQRSATLTLRGAYSTTGLTAGSDLILWLVSEDVAAFQELGVALHHLPSAERLSLVQTYIGYASASQYDPNHGPAFLRGLPPKRYLSVYPFTKTPNWYLLPFEQRRTLMIEHGKMGNEFPTVQTNTVSSFGIADQEFVVALEDDSPTVLIQMVQRLRAAAVREYTQVDTPIFLGLRKELTDALNDAL